MTDRVNPGYFRANREGKLLPVAPMFRVKQDYILVPGGGLLHMATENPFLPGIKQEYKNQAGGYFYPNDSEMPPPIYIDEPPSDALLQSALARAQTDAWDALTFAAEFRKTVETVVGVRTRAEDVMSRFSDRVSSKARKINKGVDIAKIASEVWLEMRYAWRPLLFDMQDVHVAIRRMLAGVEDPLHRAYATETVDRMESSAFMSSTVRFDNAFSGGLPYTAVYQQRKSTVEIKLHASVGIQVTTREVVMTDPVVTFWETVPFSFVLDWFITIGDCLAAFSPFATGSLRYATLGVTTTQVQQARNSLIPDHNVAGLKEVISNSMSPCECTMTTTSYDRRVTSVNPTLALQIDLNAYKILDLVALWLSINSKLTKRILRHF